ncbi:MBL fold metallo-hydrolase [Paenibacillus sp. UMB4589-SE434]|uniref:MBL fold metallo-hydrolase n=1 Tax=Paenibacillus sp. UMB4589-SE434 TaxID=3046314 RepID=UPI00254B8A63|nr:MBL fold metallo-hydrolase [Paenibacillus sp. UMB4589-SE434]MDK8183507.1 MBL fold metallo-hydrolase [Paenibacillus sp. UMB4589-SE434]
MNITQIRNATLRVQFGGVEFLIDPFLAEKGAYPSFPNTPNADKHNPLVELPVAAEEIVKADVTIVTYLHLDHFDDAAKRLLPKQMRILAQSEQDAASIRADGFQQVEAVGESTYVGDVRIQLTNGQHGTGEIGQLMGKVSGLVLTHPNEHTLYIAGDTIWCNDVETAIQEHQPGVIVVNGGAAQFLQGDPILMTKEDIHRTHQAAPEALMVVSHMESVNHCLLARTELRSFLQEKGLTSYIRVPEDGESLSF